MERCPGRSPDPGPAPRCRFVAPESWRPLAIATRWPPRSRQAPTPCTSGWTGVQRAQARAANFPVAELAALVAWVHRAGVRAFVTLTTLVFEPSSDPRVTRAGAKAARGRGAGLVVLP